MDVKNDASTALVEANRAITMVTSHLQECARRYADGAKALDDLNRKVDMVLEQMALARGKAEANRVLLGGIPNAFWAAVIALASGGVVALSTMLLKPHGGP